MSGADPHFHPLRLTSSGQDLLDEDMEDMEFSGFGDGSARLLSLSPDEGSVYSFQSRILQDSPSPVGSPALSHRAAADNPRVFDGNPVRAASAFSPIHPNDATVRSPHPSEPLAIPADKEGKIKAFISLITRRSVPSLHGNAYPLGKTEPSVTKHQLCLHNNECPLYTEILSIDRALRNSGALDQ